MPVEYWCGSVVYLAYTVGGGGLRNIARVRAWLLASSVSWFFLMSLCLNTLVDGHLAY